jgi:predicted enzyme related to lactoylglutathione lyase
MLKSWGAFGGGQSGGRRLRYCPGMARRDRAEPGTVAWVDLQTPDLDGARKFYGALLGWSFPDTTGFYNLAQVAGRNVAGLAKLGPESRFPPMWSVYLASDDVDETTRQIVAAGGAVVVAPMDVMDQGRMAYFTDPTGAYFGVWQGKQHRGAQLIDEPGAMTWHEVYTRDLERARAFYARVLGAEARRLEAPGIDYWTLHRGPLTVCGLMQMTAQFPPEVPAHWNTYFAVTDADAAAKRIRELGGTVQAPPFDTPYGRMTAVTDPFGAAFCLIMPSLPRAA